MPSNNRVKPIVSRREVPGSEGLSPDPHNQPKVNGQFSEGEISSEKTLTVKAVGKFLGKAFGPAIAIDTKMLCLSFCNQLFLFFP